MSFRRVRATVVTGVLAGLIASSGWAADGAGVQPLRFGATPGNRFAAHGTGYGLVLEHDGLVLKEDAGGTPLGLRFVGANPNAQGLRLDPSRVLYRDVYQGVDAIYYDHGGSLEYDLALRPGADARGIAFVVEGATQLEMGAHGELLARTSTVRTSFRCAGDLSTRAPWPRRLIPAGYALTEIA